MKTLRVLQIASLGALALLAQVAMASCDAPPTGPGTQNVPLMGGNLTVGRDVPLGTEIYRQTVTVNFNPPTSCSPGATNNQLRHSLSASGLQLSSWSGSPWAGSVYKTNVSGIGVAILSAASGTVLPNSEAAIRCSGPGSCPIDLQGKFDVILSFIKIGAVSSGQIDGGQLPVVSHELISDSTVLFDQINFQGTMNVVSRTCTTPDVNVDMGQHKMSEFSGKGSYTQWKDFSIVLNDCPAFYGSFNGAGPGWSDDGSAATGMNTRAPNVLQLRLDPTVTAIDSSLGILSLNPSAPGNIAAAGGVGLQVGDDAGNPVPLAIMRATGVKTTAIDGASYTFPMKARYIQMDDSVSPGPANATALYTISYQ